MISDLTHYHVVQSAVTRCQVLIGRVGISLRAYPDFADAQMEGHLQDQHKLQLVQMLQQ